MIFPPTTLQSVFRRKGLAAHSALSSFFWISSVPALILEVKLGNYL